MLLFTPEDPRPIHFMGVAGAGMSALALMATRRGLRVTGCDTHPQAAADVLEAGATIFEGHSQDHVEGARAVVYTAAVPPEHPELEAARRAGIPVVRRADALGSLVNGRTLVAVAGTHGKTTTTAMVTEAFVAAGSDPTALVGGRVASWNGNARLGGNDLYVVEADEFDRAFLSLRPTVAIVNNVEADHLECYGSLEHLEEAFVTFASHAERVLVGADDRGAVRIGDAIGSRVWRVGTNPAAQVCVSGLRATPRGTRARARFPDGETVKFVVAVPGVHNVRNAAMALAAARALDLDVTSAAKGLAAFGGVGRRFDVLGTFRGVTVVDDYAHHPSEIAATIGAARQRYPKGRIVAVFQPHLYSRTKALAQQFGITLSVADHVVVTEIYPAREAPVPGVSGEQVAAAARQAGATVDWVPDRDALAAHVFVLVIGGDVVVVMGAGDVTEVGHALTARMRGAAA
jgi:UDP-N-acetylmuramate--alanine ligase